MSLNIPIILGTARDGRYSKYAADFILEVASQRDDISPELVDVRDHPQEKTLPAWEEHEKTAGWKRQADEADGFVIVTPEYNHGYPGELKQFLDGAYEQYAHKPVAIAGVSAGNFGGARVVDLIKPTLVEFKMNILRDAMYFSNVQEVFDAETGKMAEEEQEEQQERIDDVLETLAVYADGMQEIREELNKQE